MKTRFAKVLVLLTLVIAMVAMTALPAMAATPVTVLDGQVTVSSDNASSLSLSGTTITGTAKGSLLGKKTADIVITNSSGSAANISFDYSISKANSHNMGSASGNKSLAMQAGESFTITFASNSGLSNTTATLTLSNFAIKLVSGESKLTVSYGSLGSATANGAAVESGTVISVASGESVELVAAPASGASFFGWINTADNSVISTSATCTVTPIGEMSVRAVFAKEGAAPVFYADSGAKLFEDLNAAGAYAATSSNKTVILAADGTLPAGNYTIPSGVTLLIPYNESNTLCTNKPTQVETYAKPTAYRTLTMATNANITVNGAISLSGQQTGKYGQNGMPTGPISFIKMNSGSKITVNSGAKLYAWGFITGSGAVEIMSGGTVYECFQVADFRGGDGTTQVVSKDEEYGVFPFTQYYVQNIEVPMTLHAGAVENGYFSAIISGVNQSSAVPFIGTSGTMFVIKNGYVVKDYLEGTGRTDIKLNGDVSLSPMTLSTSGVIMGIGKITVASEKYALPITNHMNVTLESGTVTLHQDIALLPGAKFYINEGANFVLGSGNKIYVYDYDEWTYTDAAGTRFGHAGAANNVYVKTAYVPGGDGVVGRTDDALVEVNGTIDVTAGEIYCTPGGANVYSTGNGVIKMTPGAATIVYNVTQAVNDNGDQVITFVEIPVKAPVLQDADGADVDAAAEGTYTYYASTGKWDIPGHRYETTVVEATCTTDGYTENKCIACGESIKSDYVSAAGHTEVTDAGKAPTCTETGLTDGSHCSVCGEVVVAQEEIAALGHKYDKVVTPPTCTDAGYTTYTCSVCDDTYVADQVDALGHTEVIDAAVPATCTEAGLSEGKHCSVCGEILAAQEIVDALGHSYGQWNVTVAPTYTEEGQQEQSCTACGDVVTAPVPVLANPVNGWNIILSDNIGVGFDMTLAETDTVAVTVNGDDAEYTLVDGILSINVAAAQMNDEIAISVNGNALAKTYSVRGYADYILDDANGFDEATKTLVKNMLVYGGAAQTYFGHNTENLASDGITVEAAVPTGDGEVAVSGKANGVKFYGASLVHETKTAVRIYFTGSIEGLTFTANGSEVNAAPKGDMYYVEIDGINPQDLGSDVTVAVSDGANTLSVSYSPLDYIVRMYNKAEASTVALVQALYGYYLAAAAYTA